MSSASRPGARPAARHRLADRAGEGRRGLEFGGWIWRYDLAPLGPAETEVRLTYDWSAVPPYIREYIQFPPFAPEHLTNSLRHLAALAASAARASTPRG
ncbi:hypothetical protein [Micromonospora sp. URMC 103]|uniref:hypothetical protein n=1 Tax=Micromonospora sp. URMC 103 TaxID=3423406 RepID=UPI003F1DC1CD